MHDHMMSTKHQTDCLIVGGGMAGLTLGLCLAQGGLTSTIVDITDPAQVDTETFDGRASAIAHAVTQMYAALGLWWKLEPHAEAMRDILVTDGRVRDGASPLFLHFDHQDSGTAPFAHMLENRYLRKTLLEAVAEEPRITFLAPDKIDRLEREAGRIFAVTHAGVEIEAPLVVAAEGARSPTREALGFKTVGWSYDQKGIVTSVTHALPHHGVAQEYFLPGGPFAILPITDDEQGNHRASLVWTERTKMAEAIMDLDEAGFTRELRARFGDYLGEVSPIGPRFSYPLRMMQALDLAGPRAALIGDAGHVVHPLAGQGLNLGLKDVAALAEVLVDAKRTGLDLGSPAVLVRYERWRRFDTTAMAVVTDGLNRLFSNDIPPVRILRDLGLGLVDRLKPVKKILMSEARGAAGSAPRLLLGQPL